jgi:hypothetical protein
VTSLSPRRWLVPGLALVVALAGACSSDPPGRTGGGRPRQPPSTHAAQPLPVRPVAVPPRSDFLADRALHVASRPEPIQLAAPPHPALQGTLAPLVVPSPDGTLLAYTTFDDEVVLDPSRTPGQQGIEPGSALGTPSIRLHDLRTGTERTLAQGAYSPAWRSDGAIAYLAGSDPTFRSGTAYTGEVVVQPPGPPAEGEAAAPLPEQWTHSEGRYVVAGWVGERLLVYHTTGNESFDIEVLDGPGAVRTLAAASSLLAVSPDGTRAAIATSSRGWSSEVQIVDIASGERVATLATDPHTSLVYGGSWVGSRLVARGGDDRGALVDVFSVGPDSLRLEKVLRVDAALPNGLSEPKLDAKDPDRMTAWSYVRDANGSGSYVLVGCDLAATACVSGPPIRARVVRLSNGSGP